MIKHARIMVIIVMGISISTFYNNCGQRSFHAPAVDVPVSIQQDLMKQDLNGKVDPNICYDSNQYSCRHDIFSPDGEDDHSELNFPCVVTASNNEFCISGLQYSHKSATQKSEYSCYLNFPDSFHRQPINSTAATYKEALNETIAVCEKVLGN